MAAIDLQQGLQLHRAGRFDAAAAVYRGILRIDPAHADAWHLAGLCAVQKGEPQAGLNALRQAVALDGNSSVYHTSLGTALQGCGEHDAARRNFVRAISLEPDSLDAWFNLANLLRACGQLEDAVAHYRQALQLRPDHPDVLNNLAVALTDLGATGAAERLLRDALLADPRHAGVAVNLGRRLHERGATHEAAEMFHLAATADPGSLPARVNLSTCLHELGRLDEAEAVLTETALRHADSAEVWTNLGNIHKDRNRAENAISCHRRALAIDPEYHVAWTNLGNAFKTRRDFEEAVRCYEQALRWQPDFEPAFSNLAGVRQSQGRTEEARRHWTRANALRPDPLWEFQLATLLPPVYRSKSQLLDCRGRLLNEVERLLRDGVRIDPAKRVVPPLFYAAYQGFDDRVLMESAAAVFQSSFDFQTYRSEPDSDRIRIGFLSAFLGDHTIGRLTHGLIRHLSREKFHVTVLAPSIPQESLAAITRRADDLVELGPQLSMALERTAAANLDVLVFPDIGMDPLTSTMARTRLAPFQCVTWGHPVTTGMPTIDAFLSSRLLEAPDAAAHYSERLVQLETLPCCYERPVIRSGGSRTEFGLPTDRPVYLCPQSLFKFHPDFDTVLAEILDRDRRGVVALIDPPFAHWKTLLFQRWEETLRGRLDRIVWLPRLSRQRFLRLLASADVMLDPMHFGGGNTNYEALGLGVPVVTLPSEFLRGRVALGLYRRMEIDSGIAVSCADYVTKAVALANERDALDHVRRQILDRCDVVYEDHSTIREIERFLMAAAQREQSPG